MARPTTTGGRLHRSAAPLAVLTLLVVAAATAPAVNAGMAVGRRPAPPPPLIEEVAPGEDAAAQPESEPKPVGFQEEAEIEKPPSTTATRTLEGREDPKASASKFAAVEPNGRREPAAWEAMEVVAGETTHGGGQTAVEGGGGYKQAASSSLCGDCTRRMGLRHRPMLQLWEPMQLMDEMLGFWRTASPWPRVERVWSALDQQPNSLAGWGWGWEAPAATVDCSGCAGATQQRQGEQGGVAGPSEVTVLRQTRLWVMGDGERSLVLGAHLSGIPREGIKLTVDGQGWMRLNAEHVEERPMDGRQPKWVRKTVVSAEYRLPFGVDTGAVSATYHDGLLTVTVPKPDATMLTSVPLVEA